MEISLGGSDTIAALAFLVSVWAVLAVPFALYLDGHRKVLEETQRQLTNAVANMEKQQLDERQILRAVTMLTKTIQTKQRFIEGMIHRLLKFANTPDQRLTAFKESLARSDFAVDKALCHLEMLSDDYQTKMSAFRALAQSFADIDTFDSMARVAGDDPNLLRYMKLARTRLKSGE